MERLLLTRHAESTLNVRGLLNGDPTVAAPLSAAGRRQAMALASQLLITPIDLCVVTAFERTRETADLALEGRRVPRMVVPELDDPPNGDFELRPYRELREWRIANGPDTEIPGTGRSERGWMERVRLGVAGLVTRPERTILAVLHGTTVSWLAGSAGRPGYPGHARIVELSAEEVSEALAVTERDVFARWTSVPSEGA